MQIKLKNPPLVLFLATLMLLSSCSGEKKIEKALETEETSVASFEVEKTEELASREALFVYSNKSIPSKNLILKFGDEPFLLSSGYIRLAGVVWGDKPVACLELGGKGLVLLEGGEVDDYRIVGIGSDKVILKKKEK